MIQKSYINYGKNFKHRTEAGNMFSERFIKLFIELLTMNFPNSLAITDNETFYKINGMDINKNGISLSVENLTDDEFASFSLVAIAISIIAIFEMKEDVLKLASFMEKYSNQLATKCISQECLKNLKLN